MSATRNDSVLVLVRLSGELATKARGTRVRFQRRLVANMRDALERAEIAHQLDDQWGRVFVRAEDDGVAEILSRVFGVKSLSVVDVTVPARLETIVAEGERVFAERVRGRSFAVRARRAGRHPFRSADIHVQLGAALDRYGVVDLDDPDIIVRVEVRDDRAYMFANSTAGAGGLPLGVGGRAVALVSGGFDSAVATWMTMKRGIACDQVFLNLGGAAYERSVIAVAKHLADHWGYGTRPRIHVLEGGALLDELRRSVKESYQQVVLKRLMYRAAEAVARRTQAEAIVTGEALGQVSSQTLANLGAIESGAGLPVLRPLIGFDKDEIVARSRAIGTYPLSEKVREYCALDIRRPVTNTSAVEVNREEESFDRSVLDEAIASARVLDLGGLEPVDLAMPYLYTSEVAAGAIVVDTRSAAEFAEWHYPGARHREYQDLLAGFEGLDRGSIYVLYCDAGLKSADLAERMQKAGFEAYSFKGGVTRLERLAAEEGAAAEAG